MREFLYPIIFTIAAFILCVVFTKIEIPVLRKLKAGQNIREEGPQAHLAKAGTPTMGGIAIVAAFIISSLTLTFVKNEKDVFIQVTMVLVPTLGYGLIGFYDDYLKIVKHENEGLSAKQKMALQIVIGCIFAAARFYVRGGVVIIPFANIAWDMGFWIIPFTLFVFVAMTNAVNLTDGLDGLSSSVTASASFFISLIALLGINAKFPGQAAGMNNTWFNYTGAELGFILCACCLGFLVFNHYPAQLFMGDTGSLALGACISSIAMICSLDFLLPLIGIIYVVEALSVIIQVVVFKTQNGRRFFRMAPIHHHFELGGWSEVKVDTVFCAVTIIMGLLCTVLMVA